VSVCFKDRFEIKEINDDFSWENLYEGELNNFNEFGDEGEIW